MENKNISKSEKKYLSLLSEALEISHKRNILLAACERMIPFMAKAIEVEAFRNCVIPDSARQAMLSAIEAIARAKGE